MMFFIPTTQPSQHSIAIAVDRFAELLSRYWSLGEIAAAMSITGGTACVLLRLLCESMGEAVV